MLLGGLVLGWASLQITGCYPDRDEPHACADCQPCEACAEGPDGPVCAPIPNAARRCEADGAIYWYDACGGIGALAETCPQHGECITLTETTATCECIRFVDDDSVTGPSDGLSWVTAFSTVQEGLDAAEAYLQQPENPGECEVWVDAGYYFVYESDKFDSIRLRPNVALIGGFNGTEEDPAERNPWLNESSLRGYKYGQSSLRVAHVVTGADAAVLDGFRIYGGRNSETGSLPGAGMLNAGCSPTVRNCVFIDNEAYSGGAVGNTNGAAPLFESCLFYENSASVGGAVADIDGSDSTFVNCTFSGNEASSGGAFHVDDSAVEIANSILWGNDPDEIAIVGGGTAEVSYSVVEGGYGGSNVLDADPLFSAPNSDRFWLLLGSPCIDAADGDVAPPTDIEEDQRVDNADTPNTGVGDPPYADIGAFEY